MSKKRTPLEMKMARALLAMPTEPDGPAPPGTIISAEYNYTNWCTGADGTRKQPYPKPRNRQCSIGYHTECSDPAGERCGCPCHWLPNDLVEACSP